LVTIGLISFPLYLWHWPILSFLRIISEDGGLKGYLKISAILLSLILAYATYKFIEKPLRFSSKPSRLWGLITTMILTSIISGCIYFNEGIITRHPSAEENAKQFQLMSEGNFNNLNRVNCSTFSITNTDLGCYIHDTEKKPNIIAIGDSHAFFNSMGLIDYFAKSNQNFSIIYQGGCLPYFDIQIFRGEKETCSDNMRDALNFAIQSNEINTVLLMSRGSWYIHGGELNSKQDTFKISILNNESIKNRSEIFYTGLHNTISKILESGKKVILVVDNPELGFNPKHCSKSRPYYITDNYNADCTQPITDLDEYDKAYNEIIQKVRNEYPMMEIYDIPKYLCDNEKCFAKINSTILYSDKNHLSAAGSKYIGEKLVTP
jgi:hypothetical protein